MRFFYFFMRTSEPCSSQHNRHFSRYSIVLNQFTLNACRRISREPLAVSTSPLLLHSMKNVNTWIKTSFLFVFLGRWFAHGYIPCGLSAKLLTWLLVEVFPRKDYMFPHPPYFYIWWKIWANICKIMYKLWYTSIIRFHMHERTYWKYNDSVMEITR